jgi:hypothetical protein
MRNPAAGLRRSALLLVLLAGVTGCTWKALAATGAVYGTALAVVYTKEKYDEGEYVQDFEADLGTTGAAILVVMSEFELELTIRDKMSADGARANFRHEDGTEGTIRLQPHPVHRDTYSRVRIRFSAFGNLYERHDAQTILDKIDEKLGGAGSA